ncbi:MAG TPA: type II toxin-antitoxin system VapC family toxin [Pyrinomonadaceae bacterium]|jgi:predicted nucleic acid-binding protein|nr:type II toxin-antitoxin system VapC family toxin [Pyrinomonadaceae bacterium]
MSFWDSSAIVPLCVNEDRSQSARRLWRLFPEHYVWRQSVVEVESTFARLVREGALNPDAFSVALKQLSAIEIRWLPIESNSRVIEIARTLPRQYGLRAMDSLQLAAALVCCKEFPKGKDFIAADEKLLKAADAIGFIVHDLS